MATKQMKPVEVEGVRGYVDKNNVAWLNAEDIARKLGFVQVKKDRVPTCGDKFCLSSDGDSISDNNCYAVVRWERVNGYLRELDCLGKDDADIKAGDYISEVWFYLLAMKANNKAAKDFQWKVAGKILPEIRRKGFYSVYRKEINWLECATANLDGARARFECERMNLEHARERLNDAVAEKNIAKAKLLRELALAATDNDLRNALIRHASKLLIDEALKMKRTIVQI